MAGSKGYYKGYGTTPHFPIDQTPDNDGNLFIGDSTDPNMGRYLPGSPTDSTSPYASLSYNMGGVYVGKRALDKWAATTSLNRTVCVLGDSTAQAAVAGADGWPERISRVLGQKMGPRLTAGAGYYGLYRSGETGSFTNTDKEWLISGTWTAATGSNNWNLAPYSSTLECSDANASNVRTVADGSVTNGAKAVVSATIAFTATDLHCLITGDGIPPDSYIARIVASNQVTINNACNRTLVTSANITIHPNTLTWFRPIAPNNLGFQVYDGTTSTSTTIVSLTANFKTMHEGLWISGTNIPAETTITTATNGFTAEISNATTGSQTNGCLFAVHDGRIVRDSVTTSGSAVITSATANFSSLDVNCNITLGGTTGIPANSYIVSVQSPTQCTINQNCTASLSTQFLFIQSPKSLRYANVTSTTAGSPTIVDAGTSVNNCAAFTQDDVGKHIVGTNIPPNTYIISVTNKTTAVLSNNITFTSTAGIVAIAAPNAINVTELQMLWVDGMTTNGASFSYSIDGGTTWTDVAQTTTGGPLINSTKITISNPTSLTIRANTAAGTKSQTFQCGILTYQASSSSAVGFSLYNIARDGLSLNSITTGGAGDPLSLLDNGLGGTFLGLRPDLVMILFTNDIIAASVLWVNAINRVIDRLNPYADILFISSFEQSQVAVRNPERQRRFAQHIKDNALVAQTPKWSINDAVLNSDTSITSATINFTQGDIGATVTGTGIPAGTTITAVASLTSATMSANATATATGVYIEISAPAPDTACAVIDMYEAWAAEGIRGYDQGYADGLIYDTVHKTQLGHNEYSRRILKLLEVFG